MGGSTPSAGRLAITHECRGFCSMPTIAGWLYLPRAPPA
jgi:hypothetical protein